MSDRFICFMLSSVRFAVRARRWEKVLAMGWKFGMAEASYLGWVEWTWMWSTCVGSEGGRPAAINIKVGHFIETLHFGISAFGVVFKEPATH